MVVVQDSDLEMPDFVITFENKTKFEPKLRHVFKEGERSRAIDLPNSDRFINKIELKYANLPVGKARLEIYAGIQEARIQVQATRRKDKKKDKKDDRDGRGIHDPKGAEEVVVRLSSTSRAGSAVSTSAGSGGTACPPLSGCS
jgi:hypothetical protein